MLRRTGLFRIRRREVEETEVVDVDYNMFGGEVDDLDGDGGGVPEASMAVDRRARLSTTREAWSSVYFSQSDLMQSSPHHRTASRRKTTFAIDNNGPADVSSSSGLC